MRVCVLIPWRGGCAHREAALKKVTALYHRNLPRVEIVLATHETGDWCKAAAIAKALPAADGADLLVVADGDVWAPSLVETIRTVRRDCAWGVPHHAVRRLSAAGETIEAHHAVIGGGIVVLRPEILASCPLDPRFKGWGCEDASWGFALRTLHPVYARGTDELVHYWHPPQQRRSRSHGSLASERLRARYLAALGDAARMRALIEEAHDA